jgi:hypothetical protein
MIRYFDSPWVSLTDLIPSGLNMGSDYPFRIPKEARIVLRFKTTSNWAYFYNRTK